jgi:metallophosphoesterase superfamily enzyme
MDILALVTKYCKNHRNETHARIASLILEENPEVELSHRSLRRMVAKERKPSVEVKKEVTSDSASYVYKGADPIHSLEDAVKYFEIDTDVWEVARFTCNSWEAQSKAGPVVMHQVKVQLERKKQTLNMDAVVSQLRETVDGFTIQRKPGSNTAVLALSDFHIGARVEAMGHTPAFNVKTVVARLQEVATCINNENYDEVYVCLLGDFIESFTGLNHQSTWQELEHGGHGTNVVILAYTIIRRFLTTLDNVCGVYIVSGNHDRITPKMEGDPYGSVAGLLAFMLRENTPVDVRHNAVLLGVEIDSIYYILTHNHHGVAKGDLGKAFWEHGRQGMYNVMLGGHWHARKGKRVYRTIEEKQVDQANYRQLSVAPLFTGNFYSESNGWNSSAGYTVIVNNGQGKPNVFEYVLS